MRHSYRQSQAASVLDGLETDKHRPGGDVTTEDGGGDDEHYVLEKNEPSLEIL